VRLVEAGILWHQPRGTVKGFHIITAIIAGLIGVIIDWIVTTARQPQTIETLETQGAPAHGVAAHS
jgi:hypothetical protein